MVWLLRRDRAPRNVQTARSRCCSSCCVAQAGVGYVQYFNDIPAVLVGVHIAGATAVWSAVVVLYLGCFERRVATAPSTGRRIAACTRLTRRRSWRGAVTVPLRPVVALRGHS